MALDLGLKSGRKEVFKAIAASLRSSSSSSSSSLFSMFSSLSSEGVGKTMRRLVGLCRGGAAAGREGQCDGARSQRRGRWSFDVEDGSEERGALCLLFKR
ncbi:hypothetical protein L484_027053 [Morus notabilis]|uniref:Uncharacterized protein n=1 Tax=Morus notabilis TaxID=981085 RepID=W9SQ17_9ROSA|nr:hypothetical protein L484_027053 [Morus notabilis]